MLYINGQEVLLNSRVGGTWTVLSGTWTIPAVTLGGDITANQHSIVSVNGISLAGAAQDYAIFNTADNLYVSIRGGTNSPASGARMILYGKSHANTGQLTFYTPNAAGNSDQIRMSFSGNLDTDVLTLFNTTVTGLKLTASEKINPASGVAGFSVVSTALTLGSAGSMIIPHADMANAANDAARDTLAGNVNGAIAIDSLGVAGVFKIWCRANGVWKSAVIE